MSFEIIKTDNAPAPVGPYSQAVKAGGFVYLSGQIPLDPKSGELVLDSISAQAELVMKNLGAVLDQAGLDYSHIIKCNIFLTDMGDFAELNEVYAKYFPNNPPARACVAVKQLPKGVDVEIEAIAYDG